jgi:hypothetical protein
MAHRTPDLFTFPNPVNEIAARTVAAGVVLMCAVALAFDVPWLLIPLVYGFWARLATGPRLSPLGQLATRVVVPALHREPRPTPGPPKRFAQGIGAVVSTSALIVWLTVGWGPAEIPLALLVIAAFFESVLGICFGCLAFGQLMRWGLIPESVCEECGDLRRRHPTLGQPAG